MSNPNSPAHSPAQDGPEPGVNPNGLTEEQQEEYERFYAVYPEYHPDQAILGEDRHFGAPREKNNFIKGFDAEDARDMYLGDFNLKPEWNTWLPDACSLTEAQQQKLFLSSASTMIKTMYHLNKNNLKR